jgi:hypothetical protein
VHRYGTAELLVLEPSCFKVEIATEKQKRSKSPGIDQILAELIQAGCNTFHCKSHNLFILFGIRKNCHTSRRNLSLYLFIKRVTKSNCNKNRGISLLLTIYKVLFKFLSQG